MAGRLGDAAVGTIVKIKVDNKLTDFIIVDQGGFTWLLMKDIYLYGESLGITNTDQYPDSKVDGYLNQSFLSQIDPEISPYIQTSYITCHIYRSNSEVSYNTKVFLLSMSELGFSDGDVGGNRGPVIYKEGNRLSYFDDGEPSEAAIAKRKAQFNKSYMPQWTRSHVRYAQGSSRECMYWIISADGRPSMRNSEEGNGIRPSFKLDPNLYIASNGSLMKNSPPTVPANLIVPSAVTSTKDFDINWGASSDPEGNLSGYILERSLDSGSWIQIYQGRTLSTIDNVPFGANTVQYRVKAYDSAGAHSGYRTGAAVEVTNNTAPSAPPSLTLPEAVNGGFPLEITWEAAQDSDGNLAGYILERQADGGDWAEVYRGESLAFTDQIVKGWETVAYRVRSYDSLEALGDYTVSETRQVNNNTPPAITCPAEEPGVKSDDFTVDYTVSDEEGDPITVTESVDGIKLREFAAEESAQVFTLGGEDFLKLANGPHSLEIAASDGISRTVHEIAFTKEVTAASVTLTEPMEADGKITVCVLSVNGEIPEDADFTVEATNNGKDDSPVWEDCTAQVKAGMNHVFENETAQNGFAFNFRVAVQRGGSGQGGYITSVQGGFQ